MPDMTIEPFRRCPSRIPLLESQKLYSPEFRPILRCSRCLPDCLNPEAAAPSTATPHVPELLRSGMSCRCVLSARCVCEIVPICGAPAVLPSPEPEPDPELANPDPAPELLPVPPVTSFFGRRKLRGDIFVRRWVEVFGRVPRTATPTRRSTAYCFCW
jgi:hypothetical protein